MCLSEEDELGDPESLGWALCQGRPPRACLCGSASTPPLPTRPATERWPR